MTVFDEREKAFENKFMHDEELRFKATAAAVRNVATAFAQKSGLTGDAATAFVAKIIAGPLIESGLGAALQAIRDQATAHGAIVTKGEVESAFEHAHRLLTDKKQ